MSVIIKHPVRKMIYENMSYFGEIQLENGYSFPCGAGLYRLDNYSFVMCEKVHKKTLSGMTILARGNSGKLTYYERGIAYGPCIEFNDEKDIVFSNTNEYGQQTNFKITIKKDGTYYISKYGQYSDFENKVLSFKKGLFCLEYRINETKERTAVVEKKVGWNFKYPFVRMFLMPYEEKSVAPAKVIENAGTYTYRGGAQTSTIITNLLIDTKGIDNYCYYDYVMSRKKEFYTGEQYRKKHELFSNCTLTGYAVDHLDDGSLYFGEVDNDRFGGICCRKYKDYDYLGYAEHTSQTPDRTGMKVYKDGVIEFGSFVTFDDVRFEIHNDFLYIKSYNENKLRGNYYKLSFDNFDLEEYSPNGELLEKITYPEVSEEMKKDDGKRVVINTELSAEELLDNDMKAYLNNFEYSAINDKEFEIYGFKKEKYTDVTVPDVVARIKTDTFANKPNIRVLNLPKSLKELEEGSLTGMKNLRLLKFDQACKITEIPSNLCDSPNLEMVFIPMNVSYIAAGAFSKCKRLKKAFVYEGCEIEKGAFPRGCKIKVSPLKGKRIKPKVERAKETKEKPKKVTKVGIKPEKKKYSFNKSKAIKRKLSMLLYPFELLLKSFKSIGKCFCSLGLETNVFSVISLLVMLVTALMNVFKVNVAINEWATGNIDVITGLFGMHLVNLIATNMSQSVLLNIILAILILVAFALDLIINVLVLVLFLVYMILFFVIGFAYALAVPIGMLIFAIVGLTQKRSATNIIILLLDIGLIVLFYVGISL